MRSSKTLLAATLLLPIHALAPCPPLGLSLPAPQSPSTSPLLPLATANLTTILDTLTSTFNYSGVSIGVQSIHEDAPLYSYHFTPPVTSGIGTDKIDEDTIWRVGSVSKMMPALAALMEGVDMGASVLRYVPELGNGTGGGLGRTAWEDVTVESLMEHLSGLATDLATDLAIFAQGPWTQMGLPEVPQGTGPTCSGLPGTKACTKADLVRDVARHPPVLNANTSPLYSNVGYAILGLVIEGATGQSFEDVVQERIFDAAGMNSSSFDGFVESFAEKGFVPVQETTWNATLGVFEAAGGMFSSTKDLLFLTTAILSNSFLSPAQTRSWMKPTSHTSSLGTSVGQVWEILRSDTLTSDGRVIDVYTKTGDLGLYHAMLGLIPEYGLTISVLCAGVEVSLDQYARSKIFSEVVKAIVPVFEEAAREEVRTYTGRYTDSKTNSSLEVTVDDQSGLSLTSFQVRSFDVLNNISLYSLSASSSSPPQNVTARIFPTGRTSTSKNSTQSAWRAVFDTTSPGEKEQLDKDLFWKDASCDSWFGLDRASYDFQSLAEFVFEMDGRGKVGSVRNDAFDVVLRKV